MVKPSKPKPRKAGRPPEWHLAEDLTIYADLPDGDRPRYKALALARSRCPVPGLESLPEDLLLILAGRDDEGEMQPDCHDLGYWLAEAIRHGEHAFTAAAAIIQAAMRRAKEPATREHAARAVFFAMVDKSGRLPTKAEMREALGRAEIAGLPGADDQKGWTRLYHAAGLQNLPSDNKRGTKPGQVETDPRKVLLGKSEGAK